MSEKHLGKMTVKEFFARFPDDDSCLNQIMEVRFGMRHVCRKCGKDSTFHRLANRPRAFACAACGDNLYPTAGTIFEDSRTPLQIWFYAIYLFVTTRHGVSGKELERVLGVTYKTAWRMGQQIRTLMAKADGFDKLQGHVEMDEATLAVIVPVSAGAAHPARQSFSECMNVVAAPRQRSSLTQRRKRFAKPSCGTLNRFGCQHR